MFEKYIIVILALLLVKVTYSQEPQIFDVDANYFQGTILVHDKAISSLVTGHPTGVILSYNKKTFGLKAWESRYQFPDVGFTFSYLDSKSEQLGDTYSLYAHYNFYFFNRQLMMRLGQGIGYNTNPFDIDDNPRNLSYGSDILGSTLIMLAYKSKPFFGGFKFQTGLSLIHFSNAAVKAPNTSTNSVNLNVGLSYEFNSEYSPDYIYTEKTPYSEPIHINLFFRGGVNEGEDIGHGQFPFYIFGAYADKVINHKSKLVLGTEFFISKFLEEEIRFQSILTDNPELQETDYKRLGVFIGHELLFNRYSLVTHAGYYAYSPYDYESRVYFRVGLKRKFGKHIFGMVSVKTHYANAEAVEFGIGYRL